jgi:excisionase family DNA binding protein
MPTPRALPGLWLSQDEAAEVSGLGLRTVKRLVSTGALPAFQVGKLVKIRASDLDDFMSAQRVEPGTVKIGIHRDEAS